MSSVILNRVEDPTLTLPLKAARSSIFWPRRASTVRSLPDVLPALIGNHDHDSTTLLATAVVAVLGRYHGQAVCVGLKDPTGSLRVLPIDVDIAQPLGLLAAQISGAVDEEALPVISCDEPEASFNPFFPVFIAGAGAIAAAPELRQDVTLAFDASCRELSASFGSRLFEPNTVDAFLGHVARFLKELLERPETPVGTLPYMSASELTAVGLAGQSSLDRPVPVLTVAAMFEQTALANPDRLAIESGEGVLSYGQLYQRSGGVGAGLIASGLKHGDLVALAARPGMAQITALLGILRAGLVPVPLDHTFPAARTLAILTTAQPKAVLTDGALSAADVAPYNCWAINTITPSVDELPPSPATLDDLVYVLFTSGSTGKPKGVEMRQSTLANLVLWQEETSAGAGSRTLNRSSFAFDVGFQEIFATLCFGHTLVCASESERADVVGLAKRISERQIDRIFVPPISLIQMAEAFDEISSPLASLRHVVVAGEAMRITPAIVRMFRACHARVTNQYGPTETHVATSYDMEGPALRWPQLPPIGKPIANARVHIIDRAGQLCPAGVRGEIAIGGLLPARGYLGEPQGTAMRFVPDRFSSDPDARMYLTGDLGRLSAQGDFEFLGRSDDQVKLRGYRIELGDIEANAMAVGGVKVAAAVLREHPRTGGYIALFLEPSGAAIIEPRDVHEQLMARLPKHMVPALGAISVVDTLPLNTNGKVDRGRLPATIDVQVDDEDDAIPLAGQVEAIWRSYLNVADIRPEDEFIALGGHSLLAIQVVSRVNDRFGIGVPIAALLTGGSLQRFTAKVEEQVSSKSDPSRGTAPVQTIADKGMLFDVKLASGRTVATPYPEEAHHYHREIAERDVYMRHGIALNDNPVVVDVGANIGLFSLAILERHPTAKLVAVEPSSLLVTALQRNLAQFKDRVTCVEAGLLDRDGSGDFTFYPNVTGMSSFLPDTGRDRALLSGLVANARRADALVEQGLIGAEAAHLEARMVARVSRRPLERLSSLIKRLNLERIDLLKIDVQRGADLILDGIDETDWPRINQIVIEHQLVEGGSTVDRKLQRAGFLLKSEQDDLHQGTDVVYTYATRIR